MGGCCEAMAGSTEAGAHAGVVYGEESALDTGSGGRRLCGLLVLWFLKGYRHMERF